ncbi:MULTISPECIES: TcpQ domain-containing protein [Asaia]|uniref:TcpQ domain-containing protein n=1 Tax=Asaia spathodeae TaxID=657016 RepID=A0ABX2P844_9PROT|nr:TcpQ domain-containing protein [Asaia spathodeae]GBR20263.1 PilL protein [Asaia spathodeae NBRC 105894]
MMRRVAGATAMLVSLVACTTGDEARTSHIDISSFRDISALTVFIADILAESLDAPKSTLRLAPFMGQDPAHAEILLTDTLRERGFGIAPDGMAYPGAHAVRYSVTPVGQNIMLALDVDDASATCLYNHAADGATQRVGQCTVRNGLHLTLRIPPQTLPGPVVKPEPVTASPLPSTATPPRPEVVRGAPMVLSPLASANPVRSAAAPITVQQPISVPPAWQSTWSLVEGQPIREQMLAWGDRAGWTVIWPKNMNWVVPVTTTFSGPYEHTGPAGNEDGVFSEVVRALALQGKSLSLKFWTTNHTAVVSNMGTSQ